MLLRCTVIFAQAMFLAAALIGTAVPSSAVNVVGDQEQERFVGSGAVLLPSNIDRGTREDAATCVGCRWKVTAPCRSGDENTDAACRGNILGCPQGREISRAWVARPGGDFEPVGLFCPSDGEVTSVSEATRRLHGDFERRIPELRVRCQPARGVVVGIPVHCYSQQPASRVAWVDSVAGFTVATTAVATWQWEFRERGVGGGTSASWTHMRHDPGAAYPGDGVRQAFSTSGVHEITARARWNGSFTVDDLGPFPITPDLEQQVKLLVPTGSALGVVTGSTYRGRR